MEKMDRASVYASWADTDVNEGEQPCPATPVALAPLFQATPRPEAPPLAGSLEFQHTETTYAIVGDRPQIRLWGVTAEGHSV
jgi:hypothetical protein